MKKFVSGLVAATALSLGVTGVAAAPANAGGPCDSKYVPCVKPTGTAKAASVGKGKKIGIKAVFNAPGNVEAKGLLIIKIRDEDGNFVKKVVRRYRDRPKKVKLSKWLKKAGIYNIVVKFDSNDNLPLRNVKQKLTLKVPA